MNDWAITNLLNDLYKLQASIAALRAELELELSNRRKEQLNIK